MYRQFNIQQFYVLPTQCIYVFCVDLRTNSEAMTRLLWLSAGPLHRRPGLDTSFLPGRTVVDTAAQLGLSLHVALFLPPTQHLAAHTSLTRQTNVPNPRN